MRNILILLAHPALHRSKIHIQLIKTMAKLEMVDIHDLYEAYPDFFIHKDREQARLIKADIIIMQFPLHWYSCPSLLREWQDLVLEHSFAYGSDATKLRGKSLLVTVSTGGIAEAYQHGGGHGHTIDEYLLPFRQLAKRCNMQWLDPFVIHGSSSMNQQAVVAMATRYQQRLSEISAITNNTHAS